MSAPRLSFPAIAACLYSLTVLGCTVSPPQIIELFWQLSHREENPTGEKSELLTFFVHVEDPDGEQDIESIYLVSDSTELYWRLQSDVWELESIDEEPWVGSSALRMYRGESFPRGAYRVLVVDRAGEQAESSLYVSATRSAPADTVYPRLAIGEDEIRIESLRPRHTLRFYDGGGEVVKLISTTAKIIPLPSVLTAPELERVVSVSVYAFDDELGIAVISDGYAIR